MGYAVFEVVEARIPSVKASAIPMGVRHPLRIVSRPDQFQEYRCVWADNPGRPNISA